MNIDLRSYKVSLDQAVEEMATKALKELTIGKITDYPTSEGLHGLRDKLRKIHKIPATHEVIITSSATEALTVALLGLGSLAVRIAEPCVKVVYDQLETLGIKYTIHNQEDVWETSSEWNTILLHGRHANHRPNIDFESKLDKAPCKVIVNDVYGLTGVNAIQHYPEGKDVVYIGSFSKIFGTAFRLGYLVVPVDFAPRFKSLNHTLSLGANPLVQHLVHELIAQDAQLVQSRHFAKLREEWYGVLPVEKAEGGITLRINVVDARKALVTLKSNGVSVEDDSESWRVFPNDYIRVNYTNNAPETVRNALKDLHITG